MALLAASFSFGALARRGATGAGVAVCAADVPRYLSLRPSSANSVSLPFSPTAMMAGRVSALAPLHLLSIAFTNVGMSSAFSPLRTA